MKQLQDSFYNELNTNNTDNDSDLNESISALTEMFTNDEQTSKPEQTGYEIPERVKKALSHLPEPEPEKKIRKRISNTTEPVKLDSGIKPEPVKPAIITPPEPSGVTELITSIQSANEIESDMLGALKRAKKPNTLIGLKYKDVESLFNGFKLQIEKALPKHLNSSRFISIISTLISKNNEIKECTPESIIGAVLYSSTLGFNAITGDCYYVPFFNKHKQHKEVQFIIGYKGLLKLMYQNNMITAVYAETVHSADVFEYELGLNRKLIHKPNLNVSKNWNNLLGVYAIAHFVNGGYNFVFLSKDEINNYRIRSANQTAESLSYIWKTDTLQMCKKTAIKRLATFTPSSDEILEPIIADDSIVDVNSINDGSVDYSLINSAESD